MKELLICPSMPTINSILRILAIKSQALKVWLMKIN